MNNPQARPIHRSGIFIIFFIALLSCSSLYAQPAQQPTVPVDGKDWLQLAAAAHEANMRKIPPSSVTVNRRWRLLKAGVVVEDHSETFECKFSGELFHSRMTRQETIVNTMEEFQSRASYQTLYDGNSFFSDDVQISPVLCRKASSVYEYVSVKRADFDLIGHPLEVIQGMTGGTFVPFVEYFSKNVSNPNFQIKNVTTLSNGNVIVETSHCHPFVVCYTIDREHGSLFSKIEVYLPGSKDPIDSTEWKYQSMGDYFVPVGFTLRRNNEEIDQSWKNYQTPISMDAKTFTMAALNVPIGARHIVSKPGLEVETTNIGGSRRSQKASISEIVGIFPRGKLILILLGCIASITISISIVLLRRTKKIARCSAVVVIGSLSSLIQETH